VADLLIYSDQRNLQYLNTIITNGQETKLTAQDQYNITMRKLYNVRVSLPVNGVLPDENYMYFIYWLGNEKELEGIEWWRPEFNDRIFTIPHLVPGNGIQKVKTVPELNPSGSLGKSNGKGKAKFTSDFFNASIGLCKELPGTLIPQSVSKSGSSSDKELKHEDVIKPNQAVLYPISIKETPDNPNDFEILDPKLKEQLQGNLNNARVIVDWWKR
jgi:hypothetical protein